MEKEGFSSDKVEVRKQILFLRFKGQETSLEVELQETSRVLSAFEQEYRKLYGHWLENRTIELESIKVVASTFPPEHKKSNDLFPPRFVRTPKVSRRVCRSFMIGGFKRDFAKILRKFSPFETAWESAKGFEAAGKLNF